MSDELVQIESKFYIELRDLYLVDWPMNSVAYYTVDNYIRWKNQEPSYEDEIFWSLNGDWSKGTIAIVDAHQLFLYTLESKTDNIEKVFELLPRNRTYLVSGMEGRIRNAILSKVDELGFHHTENSAKNTCHILRMPKEEALKFTLSIPEGYTIKPLSDENIEEVNNVYPYKTNDTLYLFRKVQQRNVHLGVFDSEDRLLAWCLRYQTGFLLALQTQEFAKKRGLATILTKAMAIEIAKAGDDSLAAVADWNLASLKLYEKLGFHYMGEILSWIEYYAGEK